MAEKKSINRKMALRVVLILVVLALLIGGGRYAFIQWRDSRVDTEQLLKDSLAAIVEIGSYRFSVHSQLLLNNYTTAETIISGERDSEGNLHVWGQIMSTNVDIYQIGDTHYRYHPANKDWTILEQSPLPDNALLLMEIDPLSNFNFEDQITVDYLGYERTHGKTLYRFALQPTGDFHRAAEFFTDFAFEVAIDRETRRICEATMTARSRSNEDGTLTVFMSLTDFDDQDIKITPP